MKTTFLHKIGLGILTLTTFGMLYASKNPTEKLKPEKQIVHQEESIRRGIKKIQLALLLDTSGSMNGLINQAKNQLWETIGHLSKEEPNAEIEIALYQYGNSGLSAYGGYIEQILPFTHNLDKVSRELFKLTTNGGDEYCGAVIKKTVNELDWDVYSRNTQKVIVIAGNEAFTQGKISYKKAISEGVAKGIEVNTIFCGNRIEGIRTNWKDGARRGNGGFFVINQDDRVHQIPTPYDDEILSINQSINNTYIPIYESQLEMKVEMEENDQEQASLQKERLVEKALIKKNKNIYKKDRWDAVDNYSANGKSVAALKKVSSGKMHKRFEGKSDQEIKKEIEKLQTERNQLHKKLGALEQKRSNYLQKKQKETKNSTKTLGAQLGKAILK
ncbi:MAG: VWA domain-containing protein [Flavobacteriales bacterium]|jgi:hypothetical protein|nr:VWA domain-containing protein [Flavobacteriales bacterium]